MSFYDYSVKKQDGTDFSMEETKGKVVMIVNTATRCGFTPQYKELEAMYEKYHDRGLEIIDIPCNQFANQAPGSDADITSFCTLKYNTAFPQMKKAMVNGENELPLYTFLKTEAENNGLGTGKAKGLLKLVSKMFTKKENDIKWNFTKFVVDREGKVVARFEPTTKMDEVDRFVEALL
jgi:glutathione peroxidase